MLTPYTLGLDIGGTRIKAGAVSADGQVLQTSVTPTHADRGPAHLLDTIVAITKELEHKLARSAAAIGLGISGAVDPAIGPVWLPGKFKDLQHFPLVPEVHRLTGRPTVAENDARAAIIAEQHFGLARGKNWVVMLTLGTGLGSGVILDGKILRNPHLQFGTQIGGFVLQAGNGQPCIYGPEGTAEVLCSATALANAARNAISRGLPSSLSDAYFANPAAIDFAAVIAGVRAADAVCLQAFSHWRSNLAAAIVSAVHAYEPDLVIIGGGGAGAADLFLPHLREFVNTHISRYPADSRVEIEASQLGDHAGMLGAASAAWGLL